MGILKLNEIPRSLDEVSQEWVEMALLGDRGGDVTLPSFRLEPLEANNSTTARLVFADRPRSLPLPSSLVLKLCPEGHGFLGASEPNYYVRDYIGLTAGPIVECYGTVGSLAATSQSVGNGYAIFLEDLGRDYTDNKRTEPDAAHAANLGHALGQLHSHHWGPDADPEGPHDLEAEFQRFLSHVSGGIEPIFADLGDELDPSSRARLTRAFIDDADRMVGRAMDGNGLTLVHGDPNPTNVLSTHAASGNGPPLYLIDRQPFEWSLRLWLGASDLVYAAAPFWPEEHRRALQHTLMDSYHRTLLENGVRSYSWEDLLEDWKSCACMAAFTAIEWGSDPTSLKEMKWLWERQLHRALVLLEDCDAGFE